MKNYYEVFGDVTKIYYQHKDGETCEILVDTDCLGLISGYPNTWFVQKGDENRKYVTQFTTRRDNGTYRTARLHRVLLGVLEDDSIYVDHINGNPLDNRMSNLRVASAKQNSQNIRPRKRDVNERGIHYLKDRDRWLAAVHVDGKIAFQKTFKRHRDAFIAVTTARAILMPYSKEHKELVDEISQAN